MSPAASERGTATDPRCSCCPDLDGRRLRVQEVSWNVRWFCGGTLPSPQCPRLHPRVQVGCCRCLMAGLSGWAATPCVCCSLQEASGQWHALHGGDGVGNLPADCTRPAVPAPQPRAAQVGRYEWFCHGDLWPSLRHRCDAVGSTSSDAAAPTSWEQHWLSSLRLPAVPLCLIVHCRDLKPGNLLLTQGGMLKLADLGISQLLDRVFTSTVVSCCGCWVSGSC